MKSKLITIGNSRGIRLPKIFIEQAGLLEDVDIQVKDGTIVITPANHVRAGWAEAAAQMHARGEDRLIDPPSLTEFDREQWTW